MATRIKLAYIHDRASQRPAGYLQDMLDSGRVDGDEIEWDDAIYAGLVAKYRAAQGPGGIALALSIAKASAKFIASGMRKAPTDVESLRRSICNGCPEWDAQGYAGLGRCNKCGCSGVKLGWATEACPLGNWGAVTPQEPQG